MKSAVIGLGVIGKVHAELLKQNGTLAAVCDCDGEKLRLYQGVRGYNDWRELLEKERPDALHICTPHCLHAEMTVAALEQNINVLCEKPLYMRREEIEKILSAERNSRAQLGVCFQNRYNPSSLYAKNFLRGKTVSGGAGTLVWRRDKQYYASAQWRGTRAGEGGGVLINQALHTVDLLCWFLGVPDFVTATVCNLSLQNVIEVEDTAVVRCTGKSGFSLFATNGGARDFPPEIVLQAEGGELRVLPNGVFVNGEKVPVARMREGLAKPCYGGGHGALIEDFYNCLRTGRKFEIDGKEGAKAVKIVLAAYESAGKEVKV